MPSYGTLASGGAQHQTAPITFTFAKPTYNSYGQYQQQQPQQQQSLYSSYQQILTPQPAASSVNQQAQQYLVNAQSFYGAPNKYQSTFSQIGGTPHKVLYASH